MRRPATDTKERCVRAARACAERERGDRTGKETSFSCVRKEGVLGTPGEGVSERGELEMSRRLYGYRLP